MAIWDWDVDRDRLRWSDDVRGMYGLARGVRLDTFAQLLEWIHPEDRERAKAVVTEAVAGGSAFEVEPGVTGFNTFRATVTDYDTGAPVAASGVTLRFSIPARPDVGSSRLDLVATGAGVFSATGGNLSLDGAWQITALVARGSASVEVPLVVLIQATPQQIDVNRVAGIPTIYTVHLSAGRTVQVYLDPDRPGKNDFHVTFFDAAGTELPATNIGVTVAGASPPRALTVRSLEAGHVVTTLNVQAVPQVFAIVGTAPGGDVLHAQLVITPGS